jgi:hypothetical protein
VLSKYFRPARACERAIFVGLRQCGNLGERESKSLCRTDQPRALHLRQVEHLITVRRLAGADRRRQQPTLHIEAHRIAAEAGGLAELVDEHGILLGQR